MSQARQPYAAVESAIDDLTSEAYAKDDVGRAWKLSELITSEESGAIKAARAIRKKLKYGDDCQIRALNILDTLIQDANLGSKLVRESLLERLRVCGTSSLLDFAVMKKCTQFFFAWSSRYMYASTPGLEGLARLHKEPLKRKMIVTLEQSKLIDETAKPFTEEEEEGAQRRSAHELDMNMEHAMAPPGQWVPHFGPAFDRQLLIKPSDSSRWFGWKKGKQPSLGSNEAEVRFVVERSINASKNLVDAIQSTRREETRLSESEVLVKRLQACKLLRRRVSGYIQRGEGSGWAASLVHANDELSRALMLSEQLDRSIDADSDSD